MGHGRQFETPCELLIPDHKLEQGSPISRHKAERKSVDTYLIWLHELTVIIRVHKAAHALALDEYRGTFTLTLWYHKGLHEG